MRAEFTGDGGPEGSPCVQLIVLYLCIQFNGYL